MFNDNDQPCYPCRGIQIQTRPQIKQIRWLNEQRICRDINGVLDEAGYLEAEQ